MKGAITRHAAAWQWLAVLGLLVLAQSGLAATGSQLRLEEAVDRTLARNPGLIALGYQVEAQQGRLVQSGFAPAPEVGLLVENALGSGNYDGLDGAETTLSLGWVLERGKRQRHIDFARAGVATLQAQTAVARLDVVAATSRLFLDVLELQEQLQLAQEAVGTAERTVAAVARRVAAGRTPAADLARAQAELALAQLTTEDLEHELLTARHHLAGQWGVVRPDFELATGDWRQLPRPGSFDSLVDQLDASPDMSLYLDRQRLRESELRLAEAQARPDWRIDAGIRRLELTDDHAFVAGITVPLSSAERNRGRVTEARASLASLDAERSASRVQVETQLFAVYQELQHSLHRADTLLTSVLPRLQDAASQTSQGYEAGRYSYYELQEIQAELLANRAAFVAAAIDAHRYQIEIERLTGAVMPPAVQQP